jgi:signal transduction histidine kinase/CheY-like chemotaxis protein
MSAAFPGVIPFAETQKLLHELQVHQVELVMQNEALSLALADQIRLEEEKLLLQEQIQQSQKLESLGVMAGGIAHDFNNILQIIQGNCFLIRASFESAETCIPLIESSVERAAVLCRQMLTYAGRSTLAPTHVIMWMLVDDVIHTLKTTISQNVVINTSYASDIPSILADASQLRQMVVNLINNASEAIGKEQGEIHVSLSNVSIKNDALVTDHLGESIPAGSYLCLEITDTGCGMDNETKRRIFEPFYTTKFTGRGLGMSAVLGILKAHNGALQLLSQTGKGSIIKVCLPFQIGEPPADKSLHQPTAATPWLGSGTILLVEDEKQIRDIVKIMLESLGFTVLEAVNGREGLEQYGEYGANITLVITDIGMPVMDGYEMFRELKKINPALPIIISSGFGDDEVTSRIDCGDIAGLISKPYSPIQLREVLKSVVEGPVKYFV